MELVPIDGSTHRGTHSAVTFSLMIVMLGMRWDEHANMLQSDGALAVVVQSGTGLATPPLGHTVHARPRLLPAISSVTVSFFRPASSFKPVTSGGEYAIAMGTEIRSYTLTNSMLVTPEPAIAVNCSERMAATDK